MPTFEDVRSIAMALPDVEEKLTWGTDVTFRIRDKMFIVGGEGSEGITLKASITAQAELIDLDPGTFSVAAYVGRFGWVNIKLDRIDRTMLEGLVRDAWRSTAPKSMRDRVPG
jgi:hypothetical protein